MRGHYGWLGGILGICLMPSSSPAQALDPPASQTKDISRTSATDVIALKSNGPSVSLKNGRIVRGSEAITLDGVPQASPRDYGIDYGTGVVYLRTAHRPGQVLSATYLFDAARTTVPAQPFVGAGAVKIPIPVGVPPVVAGLSRTVAGLPATSKSSVLNGFIADRLRQDSRGFSPWGDSRATFQVGDNGAQANLPNLEALREGLGYGLDGVHLGGTSLVGGSDLGDASANGLLQNFGFKQGDFTFARETHRSDSAIEGLGGLPDAQRAQLESESGLLRHTTSAAYGSSFGKLNFSDLAISDGSGQSIGKKEYTLDTSKFHFVAGEQNVGSGFTRFSSLSDQESAQWAREIGLRRRWATLETELAGGNSLKFSQRLVTSATGTFGSQSASFSGKNWSLRHDELNRSAGFASLPNLTAPELDADFKKAASMYGQNLQFSPVDFDEWLRAPGLNRRFTTLSIEPSKSVKLGFDSLDLIGATDRGQVQNLSLSAGSLVTTYRHERLGQNFAEIATMMDSERARLGSVPGIDRADFGVRAGLGKNGTLSFGTMDASSPSGDAAHRMAVSLSGPKLNVSLSSRRVDPGFALAPTLIDPENGLLSSLVGYKETEARASWQLMKTMRIDAYFSNAEGLSDLSALPSRRANNLSFNWNPDAKSLLQYTHVQQGTTDPASAALNQATDQFLLTRDLGKLGKVSFLDLSYVTGSPASVPGFHKQDVTYETKLNAKTTVLSETSHTSYVDGTSEDLASGTLSTQLTKNAGISVTQTQINRTDESKNENRRNYGFWYDLGKGLRVSYGYARQTSYFGGASQTTLGLTPGSVGGLTVSSATFGANSWDGSHTQANSNVSIATSKPLRLGPLHDFRMNLGMDTASDFSNWIKDNRLVEVSATILNQQIAYQYRSQMDLTGYHGIDRTIKIATDPSTKGPVTWSFQFKNRTLPDGSQVNIRDYNLVAHPAKGFDLTHTLSTNPEIVRPDLILGSLAQKTRTNRWKLDYNKDPNISLSGSFDELIGDGHTVSRTGGITATFNKKSGSPLSMFVGGETNQCSGTRRSLARYSLRYVSKPLGDRQMSLSIGNTASEHFVNTVITDAGWSIRLDYQFKF